MLAKQDRNQANKSPAPVDSTICVTLLGERVGPAVLQRIQDRFAALGRMNIGIAAPGGAPLTRPTWGSRYSELIGTSDKGRFEWLQATKKCAVNPDPPTPLTCHRGMILHATPIQAGQSHLGILVIGIRNHPPPDQSLTREIAQHYELDAGELYEAGRLLDPARGGTPEAIYRFADVLADIIATLYGQSDRIERQLADLRTVHELSELLSGSLDLQDILNRTVRRVGDVMKVKACAIRLLDEQTGELKVKAVHNLSQEYLNKGPVILQNSPIDAAAFAGHSVYIPDVPGDPRIRYPENARREGIVSGLCLPMTYRGQTIGVIRVYTGSRQEFSESQTSLLRSIGSQAASAIIHSRLYQDRAQADAVRRQIELAGQIQRRMLPPALPQREGVSFGAICHPTWQLGGDFYDFIDLPDGNLGLCIADVVGKGVPAALLMASIRSALRAYAPSSDDVARVMRLVNWQLCRDTLVSEFTTIFYGVLSMEDRTLSYCNAGHLPPLLLRGDQLVELTTGGMVIGISSSEAYSAETVPLQSGDLVVMVTDGVTEAMDFTGQSYGTARFRESILRHRQLNAAHLARQLSWDVRRFVGLAEQSDDITIVAFQVDGPGGRK